MLELGFYRHPLIVLFDCFTVQYLRNNTLRDHYTYTDFVDERVINY